MGNSGKKWFFIVLLLDALKGATPVLLAKFYTHDPYGINAVLASIFAGLIIIVTGIAVVIMFDLFSADVAIPDVTGKDLTKAISVLQDAGFKVADEQEEVTSDEVEEGDVVKTMPAAGSKKSKGTTVTIYISTGSSKVEILDYT